MTNREIHRAKREGVTPPQQETWNSCDVTQRHYGPFRLSVVGRVGELALFRMPVFEWVDRHWQFTRFGYSLLAWLCMIGVLLAMWPIVEACIAADAWGALLAVFGLFFVSYIGGIFTAKS